MNRIRITSFGLVAAAAVAVSAEAGDDWTRRGGDLQNTHDAGPSAVFTEAAATSLKSTTFVPTLNGNDRVNHTPIFSDGLLFFGDWSGYFYVIDLDNPHRKNKRLLVVDTGTGPGSVVDEDEESDLATVTIEGAVGLLGTYTGIQATPIVADVTVPDSAEPERRVYFGANSASDSLWCLKMAPLLALKGGEEPTKLVTAADVATSPYNCSPEWPISLAAPGRSGSTDQTYTTLNGSGLFSEDQPWDLDGDGEIEAGEQRDVLYMPSTGLDCADGQFYAIDPVTGERLWFFDPVEGTGGVVWTYPAMDADRRHVYVTTGDCVQKPKVSGLLESLVALDPDSGEVNWFHQRRLVDAADLDIGNSPTVVEACDTVVSIDKDGCIYAFPKDADVPQPGDVGFDPLRPGEQRLSWRRCFVPGSINGGFNASGSVLRDRTLFAQASLFFLPARMPTDDANAWALDACTGEVHWASSSIDIGRGEGAAAGDLVFMASLQSDEMAVFAANAGDPGAIPAPAGVGTPRLLATVKLPGPATQGGGGISVAGTRVFVPIHGTGVTPSGVAVVEVVPEGAPHSPPIHHGENRFLGPYPAPVAPNAPLPAANPNDPYPLL